MVKALRDSDKLIQEAASELDTIEWDATQLCRGGDDTPTPTNCTTPSLLVPVQPDPLDQLIACARSLTEDVRQVASFIQVYIYILYMYTVFKRSFSYNKLEGFKIRELYSLSLMLIICRGIQHYYLKGLR